jgi:hypothetical protein
MVYFQFRKHCETADQTHRGEAAFQWTPEVEAPFQSLKEALCTAPISAYPQSSVRVIVDTDANNVGIGGVVSQIWDGQQGVIACYSKTLNKADSNYCIT